MTFRLSPALWIFLLLPVCHIFSQATMTAAEAWTAPKTEEWAQTDTGLSIGSAGNNITWDFSSYPVEQSFQYLHLAPFLTPYFSEFPNANLSRRNTAVDIYEYFESDTVSLRLLGIRGPDDYTVFSDPWNYISYPVTWPDSVNDPYQSIIAFSNPLDTIKRTATATMKIDGWGKLKLNYITLPDVLRMEQEVNYVDSSWNFVQVTGVEKYYWWWSPGYGMVALNSNRYNVFREFSYRTDLTISAEKIEPLELFAIYPNPAEAMMSVRFGIANPAAVLLEVWDVSGRRLQAIATGILGAGTHEFQFDTGQFPAGNYVLMIQSGGKPVSGNFRVGR